MLLSLGWEEALSDVVGSGPEAEERELILASQKGDLDSFNKLVERYQRQVYNLALRMLGLGQAAEDATQEAFLSAFRAIRGFRGGSFKAWLLRITANACYDQLRLARRRPSTSLEAILDDPARSSELATLESPDESPEDRLQRLELARVINHCLARLPTEQRLVVVLCDIQGLSYDEAAQAAGCSLGTVKSRLSRGRSHLRNLLRQHRELLPRKFVLNNGKE
jgi:RNA polymerase sigma-70 factor (ECF subfamily)